MLLKFKKYHGTGNDFILIDNFEGEYDKISRKDIIFLCDRHFGIGSDGVIILNQSIHADYRMDFYNPDGSQSFCGNGSRCAFQFAHDLGIIRNVATFEAIDGSHQAKFYQGKIAILMNDVSSIEENTDAYFIHTGSPHYIQYVDSVNEIDLLREARAIRYNDRFKKNGTNVNFVEDKTSKIAIRTYERGVENETLSCGTGVTAAALSYALKKNINDKVNVATQGGELSVSFNRQGNTFNTIWLIGPAEFVFEGDINI